MSNQPHPPTVEEINKRLVDQYTEIATLAGGLAHEIKNPLSTIRLSMELLAEDFADSQEPRDRRALAKIRVVERECLRLQGLLDDFLNYTKLRTLRLEPCDLNEVILRVLEFFAPQAAEADIEVIRYLDPDLPSVVLDREAFHGALINLVLNAQHAMPDGGQLVVRTRAASGRVAIDLIDTGCGLDEETSAHMFDAFYSTKPGGSGLGLPTTRKLVEALGGRIAVLSDVGQGTQFTIELPLPARLTVEGNSPHVQP